MKSKALMLLALAVTLVAHAPAETLVGVSDQNALVVLDSANPAVVINTAPITGVQTGESIVSLDFNPNTGDVLGISSLDRVFRLDPYTGVASLINAAPFKKGISGNIVTLEIDPVIGDIRILDNLNLNAALDTVLGAVTGLVGGLIYALGDIHFLQVPQIISGAIDNLNLGDTAGVLYLIDLNNGSLVKVVEGLVTTLHTVAPITGIDLSQLVGFDIAESGVAIVAQLLSNNEGTSLYLLNLLNGTTTILGSTTVILRDITVINPPPENGDTDGDGVPNISDRCPESASGAIVDQFGCSIEQLCPCSGPRTGGVYVKKGYTKCVGEQSKRFAKAGIITKTEAKTLKKMAKTSPCNPPKVKK